MSELISGKEALIALANGEEVEFKCGGSSWRLLDAKQQPLEILIDPTVQFRLKLRTISINNIEVPATFNPKEGEIFYYINDYSENGYDWVNYCDNLFNNTVWIGKWRTEAEIKQVIAALRSVFNSK